MNRRQFIQSGSSVLLSGLALDFSKPVTAKQQNVKKNLSYDLKLETITRLFNGKQCWAIPRIGRIPGNPPVVVINMNRNNLYLKHPDMFSGVYTMRTDDLGRTWQGPDKQPDLVPRTLDYA